MTAATLETRKNRTALLAFGGALAEKSRAPTRSNFASP